MDSNQFEGINCNDCLQQTSLFFKSDLDNRHW